MGTKKHSTFEESNFPKTMETLEAHALMIARWFKWNSRHNEKKISELCEYKYIGPGSIVI